MESKSLIGKWITEYLKTTEYPVYKDHCEKFYNYIKLVQKLDRPNEIKVLDIDNCIGYYSDLGKINTESTMAAHVEVLKSFYDYLHEQGISRDVFNDIPRFEQFKADMKDKYDLSDTEERDYLQLSAVLDLLEYFENNKSFNDIDMNIMNIFIKLTLIAPAKKGVITTIAMNDFCDDFRFVMINGIRITLTNSLRRDILFSIGILDLGYEPNSLLFEVIAGKKVSQSKYNELLIKYLREIGFDVPDNKKTYSVEKILNTALVLMIKNNVNPLLIAKINDTTLGTIGNKVEKYGVKIVEQDLLINNAISCLEYHSYL